MKRWSILLLTVLGLAAIGAAGYFGFHTSAPPPVSTPQAPTTVSANTCDVQQTVSAPGVLVNTHVLKIEMPVSGRLAEVLAQAGDNVQAGQVLARLGGKETFEAHIAAAHLDLLQAQKARADLDESAPLAAAQAKLALDEAQAALETARENRAALNAVRGTQAQIDIAQANVLSLSKQVDAAQTDFDQVSGYDANDLRRANALAWLQSIKAEYNAALNNLAYLQGSPTPAEITAADGKLTLAQAQLNQAQSAFDSIKDGPGALDVALADSKVGDAQAKLAAAQEDLASLEIKAPFSGTILEQSATAGETIPAGTPLFTLNDPQAVEIEATVTEEDFPVLETGMPTSEFFDAMPDEVITGAISRIVPKRAPGDRPLYYVYLSLDRVPARLVAGMSADAAIVIAERKGATCLPRALVKTAANGTAVVDVWANGQREKRTLKVGLRGDASVEILSGLKVGEKVVSQ